MVPALDSSGREGADYIRSSLREEFFRAALCAFDPPRLPGFFSLACFSWRQNWCSDRRQRARRARLDASRVIEQHAADWDRGR